MMVTTGHERRQHSRHKANIIMDIRGHVEGSQIAEIRGVTVDVGSGGALAVFTDHVPADPDHPFMVRFVDAAGNLIAPGFRWGAVLRSDRDGSKSVVAVKFQQALPSGVLGRLLGADAAPAALTAHTRPRRDDRARRHYPMPHLRSYDPGTAP